jgi:hypothetical protein
MPILSGAVAYRSDVIADYQQELWEWGLQHRTPIPVECPKGCRKSYGLIVEINASPNTVDEHKAAILRAMGSQCPNHESRIRLDPP